MRRLEAHGDEYKLAPVYKLNALRMLMTGKAKEYFDLWERDRDSTDAAKSYEELLNNVKDYAKGGRKIVNTAHKNMQHGGDPMDVGAINIHDNSYNGYWENGYWENEEIDTSYGRKDKEKGTGAKRGSQCFICGSTNHFAK